MAINISSQTLKRDDTAGGGELQRPLRFSLLHTPL